MLVVVVCWRVLTDRKEVVSSVVLKDVWGWCSSAGVSNVGVGVLERVKGAVCLMLHF